MKRYLVVLAAGATFAAGLAALQQRDRADAEPARSEPARPAAAPFAPPALAEAEGAPDRPVDRAPAAPKGALPPLPEGAPEPAAPPLAPAAAPLAQPAPTASGPPRLPSVEVATPPPRPADLALGAAPATVAVAEPMPRPAPAPQPPVAPAPAPPAAPVPPTATPEGGPVTFVQVVVQPPPAPTQGGMGPPGAPPTEAVRRGAGLITQGDYVPRPPLAQPFGPGVVTQATGGGTVAQPFAPAALPWALGALPWALDPNAAAAPFESPEEGVLVPPGPLTASGPLFPDGTPPGPLTARGSFYAPAEDEGPAPWSPPFAAPAAAPAEPPPLPAPAPQPEVWAMGDCGWLDTDGVRSRLARLSVAVDDPLPLHGACFEVVGSVRTGDHWSLELAGPVTHDRADRDRAPAFILQVDLPLAGLRGGASLDVVAAPGDPEGFLPGRGQAKAFLDDNRAETDLALLGSEADYAAVGGAVHVHRFERRAVAPATPDALDLVATLDLRLRRLDRRVLPPAPVGPPVSLRAQLRVHEAPQPETASGPAAPGPLDTPEAAPLEK